MWRSLSVLLIALTALALPAPLPAVDEGSAGSPDSPRTEERRQHAERLAAGSAAPAGGRLAADGRLTRIRGRFDLSALTPAAGRDPEAAARSFLARHASAVGLPTDLGDLTLVRRSDDRGGTVLTFEQRHEGLPVDDGTVIVGLDLSGRLIFLSSDFVPGLDVRTSWRVTPAEARARAEEATGGAFDTLLEPPALVVVEGDKTHAGHRLAWRVHGLGLNPRAEWLTFVDAMTAEVIRILDLIRRAGPACIPCNPALDPQCGRIFFLNPVVVLDNPSLTDSSNVDATQTGCALQNMTSSSLLDGLFVNTSITASRTVAPWNWTRSANQPAVDEVTVWYHVNRAKQYLNTLGFPEVMNFSIDVDAHDPMLGDNSHFVPGLDILEFGVGGVDDGQDPDIIYHEYGHAIQDNQVTNFGESLEGGSMGEGFGDYWGAVMMDEDATTLLGTACVGEWDATSYDPYTGSPGTGCLRRVDGAKQYPRDRGFQVHNDGEMWSAALWRLRQVVGGAVAEPLVIKSHTFLTPTSSFIDGADALLAADIALNDGAFSGAIDTAMAAGGIPRSALPAPPGGLIQTTPFVCETAHNYANLEYKECKLTVPGATRVRFHFSRLDTEAGFDFVRISDPMYREVQSLSGLPFGSGAGSSATVHGDTIVARFKADPSKFDYGFRIDSVQYATGAGEVPDGSDVSQTPLTVDHAAGGAITLTWGESCGGGNDYAIYQGTLGNYTSHVPVACSTGGLTTSTFVPPGHSTYYLVVPVVPGAEGSYGRRSNGTERPASGSACRPQQIIDQCS